jgi:hypothetical protein
VIKSNIAIENVRIVVTLFSENLIGPRNPNVVILLQVHSQRGKKRNH